MFANDNLEKYKLSLENYVYCVIFSLIHVLLRDKYSIRQFRYSFCIYLHLDLLLPNQHDYGKRYNFLFLHMPSKVL